MRQQCASPGEPDNERQGHPRLCALRVPDDVTAGTSATYYRCSLNRTKGMCDHATSFREDIARTEILDAIRERLLSADGLTYVRRRIAEELRNYSKRLETEIKDRRERLKRTEEKIRGLIEFIASGDRSATSPRPCAT